MAAAPWTGSVMDDTSFHNVRMLEPRPWQAFVVYVPRNSSDALSIQTLAHDSAQYWLSPHALQTFGYLDSAAAEHPLLAPSQPSTVSLASGCNLNLSLATSLQIPPTDAASESRLEGESPSASGLCTPEITPRYHAPGSCILDDTHCRFFLNNIKPEILVDHADMAEREERTENCIMDKVSECDSEPDWALICWDYVPRDPKSYAASDASTTVSIVKTRSARRRRGRRNARAKAKASSVISEAPVFEALLVTEEEKRELMQQLEVGGVKKCKAIADLHGAVLRLSLEPYGCRVVQRALEVANKAEKEDLACELQDHVRLAIASPHANFVLQKIIDVLPVGSTGFIADELSTVAGEVARHKFGCRVLCRLVEHHLCVKEGSTSAVELVDELLLEADQLLRHNFARHVLEKILEHGSEAHKQRIIITLRSSPFQFAKNRYASYVFEKVLLTGNPVEIHALASDLLAVSENFLMLAGHECGMHVVKAVAKSHTECAVRAKKMLLGEMDQISSSKFGKRLLEEM
jgi:hypothetical protein